MDTIIIIVCVFSFFFWQGLKILHSLSPYPQEKENLNRVHTTEKQLDEPKKKK